MQQAVTTLPLEQEGAESNESSQVFTLKIGLCIFPVSYQPAAQDAQTVADQLLYEMQPVLESTTNKASTLAEAEEQAVLIAYRTIKGEERRVACLSFDRITFHQHFRFSCAWQKSKFPIKAS